LVLFGITRVVWLPGSDCRDILLATQRQSSVKVNVTRRLFAPPPVCLTDQRTDVQPHKRTRERGGVHSSTTVHVE